MFHDIKEIESLAVKYSKNELRNLASLGLLDPTKAVLAGNIINNIEAQNAKPPETTVAQDSLGIQGAGTGAMAGTQLGMQGQQQGPTTPQPQPQQPQMAQALTGMETLPAGDVGNYSMAGGGIIAFDDGGYVPGYADRGYVDESAFMGDNQMFPRPFTEAERFQSGLRSIYQPRANSIDSLGLSNIPVKREQPADKYGIPLPNPQRNLDIAKEQVSGLIPEQKARSINEIIDAQEAVNKRFGVDENIFTKQKQIFEDERTALTKDREDAKGMRLIEAGLGIMAGESPHAFVNIGKGATPALQGLANDIKDIKKADKELVRSKMALDVSENNYKMDKSKSAFTQLEKDQERVDKNQQARASATASLGSSLNTVAGAVYGAQTSAEASRNAAELGYKGHLASAAATRYASDHEDRQVEKLMKSNPGMTRLDAIREIGSAKNPKDQYNALSLRFSKARAEVAADPTINNAKTELARMVKDKVPPTDPEYKAVEARIKNLTDQIMSDNWIDATSHKLIQSLEGGTASRAGAPNTTTPAPPPAATPTAGKYSTVAPDGRTYTFDTPQQLKAFKDRLARLAKEDREGQ